MKIIIAALTLLVSTYSFGGTNDLNVGCISGIRSCIPTSENTCKYAWLYENMGGAFTVTLTKSGDDPTFEVWEGMATGDRSGVPFHLNVYQRRESSENENYLTVETTYENSTLSASGRDYAQVSIVNNQDQKGVIIRCAVVVPVSP